MLDLEEGGQASPRQRLGFRIYQDHQPRRGGINSPSPKSLHLPAHRIAGKLQLQRVPERGALSASVAFAIGLLILRGQFDAPRTLRYSTSKTHSRDARLKLSNQVFVHLGGVRSDRQTCSTNPSPLRVKEYRRKS